MRLLKQQSAIANAHPRWPSYWTVEEDKALLKQKSYVLTTGDPAKRPKRTNPSSRAFRFSRRISISRDGRREGFVEWLTAPANPLFARVAVNRIWALAFR